jgi:hypothetical protein
MNQLRRLAFTFGGITAEPAKGVYNAENTPAETFNLEYLARYSIMSHP